MVLESIKQNIQEHKGIGCSSFEEMTKSKVYQQGLKDYKESNMQDKIPGSVKSFWVTKMVSLREWNIRYSLNNSYCKLGVIGIGKGKQVGIGFIVAHAIPEGRQLCTDEELMMIDTYRRANNICPMPFKEVKKEA